MRSHKISEANLQHPGKLEHPRPERIRRARMDKGLTQAKAAELVGVQPNTIYRYEAGHQKPSQPMLIALRGYPTTLNEC